MGKPTRPRSRPWSNAPPGPHDAGAPAEGHHAEAVRDGLVATIATLPAHLRGIPDLGPGLRVGKWPATSNSRWPPTCPSTSATRPAPGSAGTNENTNGLLRQYFPKAPTRSVFSPADLEHVAQQPSGCLTKRLTGIPQPSALRGLTTASLTTSVMTSRTAPSTWPFTSASSLVSRMATVVAVVALVGSATRGWSPGEVFGDRW